MDKVMYPDEFGFAFASWLGVPALVLLPLNVALAAVAWYRGTLSAAAALSKAQRSAGSFWVRTPWARCVGLALTGAITVASVFALCRFVVVLFSSDSPIRNFAEFEWEQLWVALLTYRDSAGVPIDAAFVALGVVATLCSAAAFKARGVFEPMAWVSAYILVVVALLLGVLLTVLFLMVAALVFLFNDEQYHGDHLVAYGTPAVLCFLFAFGLAYTIVFARQVFGLPARGVSGPSHAVNYQYRDWSS